MERSPRKDDDAQHVEEIPISRHYASPDYEMLFYARKILRLFDKFIMVALAEL